MDELRELLAIQARCVNRGDWDGWVEAQKAINVIVGVDAALLERLVQLENPGPV